MTQESDVNKIRNAAIIGTGVNIFLSFIKFLAGSVTASISLIADGINSLSDVFPSLAVAVGIKISERPPTEKFPYGFHKIENLLSLFISLAIFYGAYEMITEALNRFGKVQVIENPIIGVITAIVSTITLYLISTYKIKIGRKTNSPSLTADGEHSRVDVLASLAVLVGVSGSFFSLYILDAIAAIVASIFVIRAGYETFKDSTKILLDASVPYETRDQIKEIALETPGVKKVRWIRARGSGELPHAEAMRLPASTTDSIPLTGYGGLMSTGVNSLRPVGTRLPYIKNAIYKPCASIHPQAKARGFLEAFSVSIFSLN